LSPTALLTVIESFPAREILQELLIVFHLKSGWVCLDLILNGSYYNSCKKIKNNVLLN